MFNYYIIELNTEHKIGMVLKEKLESLSTHYRILLETQKMTASMIFQSTVQMPEVIEIMSEASSSTKNEKAHLRARLHNLLYKKYNIIKQKGVLQYHFVLPNNESFYRAHKPDKFGDDLTNIRSDFKYVNETHRPTRGFVQGRTAHGFRNAFPLFDKNYKYIGAVEVSFSSDRFQWYMNNISNIHSHFIVDKSIFNTKAWKRDDLVLKYEQSAESKEHMITLGNTHDKNKCVTENRVKLLPIKDEIVTKLKLSLPFSNYVEYRGNVTVVSFLPIMNVQDKAVAWTISYVDSPIIHDTLLSSIILKLLSLLITLLITYFLVKQIFSQHKLEEKNQAIEEQKEKLQRQHQYLNEILNSTDNIMFITDFKDVKYSNNMFKNMLKVKQTEIFNQTSRHNLLSIFINIHGYLHSGLLEEGEDFMSLIKRTPVKDRVVSILDNNSNPKAFQISVTNSENSGDYLVSLSDITKIKEYQVLTEQKAYIDGLTNVYNRNKLNEIFAQEIKNSKRYKTPLTIAILDIDKFKDFNDTYGHLIGDEVLITMAQTVQHNIRETDTFARWGGEEFVILFINTTLAVAKSVSEKLKNTIEQNTHDKAGKITSSFGLTQYIENDTQKSMFERCDRALYKAKENGRNRVEIL